MPAPATLLLPALAAIAIATASGGCKRVDRWGSLCTEAPVRVLDTRTQRLPVAAVGDPILDGGSDGIRVEVTLAQAEESLRRRVQDMPMTRGSATALRERLRRAAAAGEVVDSADILEEGDSLPPAERQAGVLEANEAEALLTRALRDGTARVLVDGRPLDRVDVEYYEADDAFGKTHGVRFIGGGRKVLDYCATDPDEDAS